MGSPDPERIFEAHSVHDLAGIAGEILSPGMRVILLRGDLGSGKTTLVKAFCQVLGSTDAVSSPTFSLVNEYRDSTGGPIYHIDLYRLETAQEALLIGIEEYLSSGAWCFIEWPEVILQEIEPGKALTVTIEVTGDNSRRITTLK